jgi:alkanesulfonate monooxygenase SsuD/methylene tetrahydromethanopterin reductase-like flavin-dependent oxidoreductase (luciferase family)
MRFGVFYEHQLPKPWKEGDEAKLFHEALEQVVLADKLGYDCAWEVEHHFLEEYSHSSAPEVFLYACAALTKNIRVGHGIRQVIANYNHPARSAECLATLESYRGAVSTSASARARRGWSSAPSRSQGARSGR